MGKNPELELPDGRKLARSADSWLRQRSRLLNQDRLATVVEPLFDSYLEGLRGLGIMKGVVVGSKAGERQGYIWPVFAHDFSIEQVRDSRVQRLNPLGFSLQDAIGKDILPLYIAYLSLSDLSEHLEICKKQGIDVEFVEF